jgi:hypothetical protein
MPRVGNAEGYVFTVTGNKLSGFSKAKEELDAAIAKIARADGENFKDWTLHDLRRTATTGMNEEIGILPHIGEAVINRVFRPQAGRRWHLQSGATRDREESRARNAGALCRPGDRCRLICRAPKIHCCR